MKLLRIDASARTSDSHSRNLADTFVEQWLNAHPGGEVMVRDLVKTPLPHISADAINGFYTPRPDHDSAMQQATALSDELIAELKAADEILIDTPMYNFSVPSALKAWIDQIVRINETFSFDPEKGFAGLLQTRQAWLITASGAVFSAEGMQALDFLTPYLKTLLGFLGVNHVEVFALEGTSTDAAVLEKCKQHAMEQINQLARVA